MNKLMISLTTALLAVSPSIAEPEITGTPTELRQHLTPVRGQVTILGQAERTVEADRAVVELSVVTSEHEFKKALENNNTVRTKIVSTLADGGLSTNRIHTSRFASTPVHSSWTGKVKEYNIKSTVRIYAETEKEIQLAAGLVDTLDEVILSSINFEMTKKEEITMELLEMAFDRVQERKELYEASLNVKLQPNSIGIPGSKNNDRRHRNIFKPEDDLLSFTSAMTNPELSVVLHALKQREPDINQFEELLYKISIAVTFDLLPNDAGE